VQQLPGLNVEDTPAGILKNELRRFKSLVMQCADEHAVPAGRALAVDRESFSQCVTEKLRSHPMIEINCKEVEDLPEGFREGWQVFRRVHARGSVGPKRQGHPALWTYETCGTGRP